MLKRFLLLFQCLLLFTGQQYVASGLVMGYEYIQEADAWLRLHSVPATWADARLRCRLEGGVLASPTTDALVAGMSTIWAAHKPYMRGVFTGIHDLASKGDFVSLEGVPLTNISLLWADGEPDNAADSEDCLMLTSGITLAAVSCTRKHPYFCRKERTNMVVNRCGTTAPGYEWQSRTGSCYKFHRVARTWHRAAMACHAEGGHLAVVNSATEAEVLSDIYGSISQNSITGAPYTDVALIGFWKWNDRDGEWLTVHGETLAEAGYNKWDADQPNNFEENQYCGSIFESGLLNDTPCDSTPLAFICEITPYHDA